MSRRFILMDIYRKAMFLDVLTEQLEHIDWQDLEDFVADCRLLDKPDSLSLPKLESILNYFQENDEWDGDDAGSWFALIAKELRPHLSMTDVVFEGYSDAVSTLCQGWTIGSTTCESTGLTLPALYQTSVAAQQSIDEDRQAFVQAQQDGERDDDDEFDVELIRVQILADGSLLFPDSGEKTDVISCTGCNPLDFDVRRIVAFSPKDCL